MYSLLASNYMCHEKFMYTSIFIFITPKIYENAKNILNPFFTILSNLIFFFFTISSFLEPVKKKFDR